jgi:hypothetical protein
VPLLLLALARLRRSSPAPQLSPAGPRPPPARSAPLPRLQRLTGGARLSSPPSRYGRAGLELESDSAPVPAARTPFRAWPARQGSLPTYLRPPPPRVEPAEALDAAFSCAELAGTVASAAAAVPRRLHLLIAVKPPRSRVRR